MTISYTPAVREALNTRVINKFALGAQMAQVSGALDLCGPRTTDAENLVVFIAGKNFKLRRRDLDSDQVTTRAVDIYEQRSKIGSYMEFLSVNRKDALYPAGIDKIMATAETAGAIVAEAPTRMVEALVPAALGFNDYTGTPFFSQNKPIKPGSSETFDNIANLGALDFDAFDEAEKRLAQIKRDDGRSTAHKVRVLAYGSTYKRIAQEIIGNPRPKDYAGGDNLRAQDRIVGLEIADWGDEFWCVFDTSVDSDMPFYYVESRPLRLKPLYTDPEGAWETMNGKLVWGVEGDMSVALGTPQRAFMSVNPANVATILATYKSKFELNDFDFKLGN